MENKNTRNELYFKQLVIAAQNNNEQSYKRLLVDLSPILRCFILKHMFDANNAEDVLQETLLGIHKALHTYNSDYKFTTWCFAICKYKIIDNLRKYQKVKDHEVTDDEFIETFEDTSANNNIDYDLSEDIQIALDKLPSRQKKIVLMLKVNEYSIKQVAQEMKLSVANVKTTAHRAYKALRESLNNSRNKQDNQKGGK